jgi:hypothetical protein
MELNDVRRNDAWQEIVSGSKLDHAIEAVMERARPALEILERAMSQNLTTGKARRLEGFFARSTTARTIRLISPNFGRTLDARLTNTLAATNSALSCSENNHLSRWTSPQVRHDKCS